MGGEEEFKVLQTACWAVLQYLDTLPAKGVDPELLMPIRAALVAPGYPLTPRDVERGQRLYRMMTNPDGTRREVTMGEAAASYLRGYRDGSG